jgi:hypothetical protein
MLRPLPIMIICLLFIASLTSAQKRPKPSANGLRVGCALIRTDPPDAHIFDPQGMYLGDTSFKVPLGFGLFSDLGEEERKGGAYLETSAIIALNGPRARVTATAKKRGYADTPAEMWMDLKYTSKDAMTDAFDDNTKDIDAELRKAEPDGRYLSAVARHDEQIRQEMTSFCPTLLIVLKPQ